ncbi:hypothetical protein TraAM80_09693 [Trypanosoma rangeli]|uniref:Uncharacterized protein n=1 Tax=Trypanosoma rangeli TaxID=5698 RepID=A0A3R7JTL7_TRYRA|nr:uncharacterized protein TraAM80_09693 [Trypanosoma rangeli]RNE96650.1 hypothetical protein TraAM80_09693 [Trypanosoma rangeli]|eukprot:RNE96650.1 hypothetical protein TraAM80_09693 [Trypanosoma rangeli]
MAGVRQPQGAPHKDTTVTVALRRRLLQCSEDTAAVVRVVWRRRDLVMPSPSPWRLSQTTAAGEPRSQSRRPRKDQLLCAMCRLSKREWQYCGLTGEQHVVEE